jgi:hypothetical protein
MALGLTQPLIEMSTKKSVWGGKARPTLKNITAICESTV